MLTPQYPILSPFLQHTAPMFSKLFKKKDDSGGEFKHDPNDLWYIEGKAYDLNKFTKAHPGMLSMYGG